VSVRVLRWKPASHPQVWGLAVVCGLSFALAGPVTGHTLDLGLAVIQASIFALGCGATGSFLLSRRRDAAVVADWLASRSRSQPPEQ
jgi:hypothetical protein